jgi:hypothetical protein
MENFADLYCDYLICSNSYTTATGMASLLDITHDKVTRAKSQGNYDSTYLWNQAKVYVRELTQSREIITLSFDDSIEEKRYTDESELICWHFDHTFGRSVKGINFLSALLEVGNMRIPVGVELIKKDIFVEDPTTGKQKRKSSVTKNELFRKMLRECYGKMHFNYVLTDSWYSSIENMICCKVECKSDFIMALKSNRLVALTSEDKASKNLGFRTHYDSDMGFGVGLTLNY